MYAPTFSRCASDRIRTARWNYSPRGSSGGTAPMRMCKNTFSTGMSGFHGIDLCLTLTIGGAGGALWAKLGDLAF
jgi:hypothetical protein